MNKKAGFRSAARRLTQMARGRRGRDGVGREARPLGFVASKTVRGGLGRFGAGVAALLGAGAISLGAEYSALIAFGDSLTDTWREPSESPAHFQGRWSNGPLWIEYLAEKLGLAYDPNTNYAHSGAQTDDTLRQIEQDFVPPTEPARALYVVFAGGNDFLQNLERNLFSDAKWNATADAGALHLAQAVAALHARGARVVLVPNVVDVTQTPTLNKLPGFLLDFLREKVRRLNTRLVQELDQVQAARPDLRLIRVDFYTLSRRLIADYRAYGFTNNDDDAITDLAIVSGGFDGPGATYVFWDPIHPSTKSHAIIAQWFFEAVVGPQPLRARWTTGSGGLRLLLDGAQIGRTYWLERSVDLLSWQPVESFFTASVPPPPLTAPVDQALGFFRVRLAEATPE